MNPLSKSSPAQTARRVIIIGMLLLVVVVGPALAQTRVESLERPGGARLTGHLAGDNRSGFAFISSQSSVPIALETGLVIHFNGAGPTPLISAPPFRFLIGESLRLSGFLRSITEKSVRLGLSWQTGEVTIPRPGVQAIVQRHGESRVLVDGFEALDLTRWSISGKPEIATERHLTDRHSLRLTAGGGALVHHLNEPVSTGRFDVAFHDDGVVAAGQQWSIELTFQGPAGMSVVRVILGWAEESLALESPSGLAIQHLARTPGWHRFSLRFGPNQTEASVDGKELAHGKGPDGSLVALRLASAPSGQASSSKSLAGYFDDLQLIRYAEPPASLELDANQDEARLVVGDQLFGTIKEASNERISMTVDKEPVTLSWSDVSGIYFRRTPATSVAVEGPLVRVEWRSASDDDRENIDLAEGALSGVSEQVITLDTPFAGRLSIPLPLLRKMVVAEHGRRIVIDPAAHHLGDEFSSTMPIDPPLPEGGLLERTLDLPAVPSGDCFVVLDVVQLVSEHGDPDYSQQIRNGELRTYLAVNGRRIDYLNHYLKTNNLSPERIAIPVPAGSLHPGKNSIRLELTGLATNEKQLDDFGLLQLAVEFRTKGRPVSQPAHEPGHP